MPRFAYHRANNTRGTYRWFLFFFFTFLFIAQAFRPVCAPVVTADTSKFLGNIIAHRVSPPSNFTQYWNQVTPENSGKWGNVERGRDTMNWKGLDSIYLYAKRNNLLFKQHTFVWGLQEPIWIKGLAADEQRQEVEDWIKAFAERYPDHVDFIDVVNEPINTPPSFREALGGSGTTGWDWVVWAFEKARQYCPQSKLLINEFNIEKFSDKCDQYVRIIDILKEKALIDGIGVQSHYFTLQGGTSLDTIKANLDKLAKTGLKIYCSELDITGNDSIQLSDYQRIFPILWKNPSVAGVTLWGWLQGYTWNDSTFLIRQNGVERPAFQWLRSYVAGEIEAASPQAAAPRSETLFPFSFHGFIDGGIRFHVRRPSFFGLRIVDLKGRTLMTHACRFFPRGDHIIPTPSGGLSAGVYQMLVTTRNGTRAAYPIGGIVANGFPDR
jgi:endo-1,4-beta-xylanase